MKTMKTHYDLIIVGGGPMGIVTAIEAKKNNLTSLILEKGALVNSIYGFPKNMTFFSTSQKLEIGGVPFMSIIEKPTRSEALEYYRRVVEKWDLKIHLYEEVLGVSKSNGLFQVKTAKRNYTATNTVICTGFYSVPNYLNIPGEDLDKVEHYYNEAHPYIGQKVVVIGAANSACQVALELYHKGIDVTMLVRGPELKYTVKYWIKPNIENRIKEGSIKAFFNANVTEITATEVHFEQNGELKTIENDAVLAMTGYRPDYDFLAQTGITNCDDEYDTPNHDDIQQTNINGMYLAGVVCGGLKTNRYIIENSIEHAETIINDIVK